jgi:hypothetical protein
LLELLHRLLFFELVQFLLYFSGHGFANTKGSPHVVGTDANTPSGQAVNLKKDFVVPLDRCCDGAAIILLVDACMVAPEVVPEEQTTALKSVSHWLFHAPCVTRPPLLHINVICDSTSLFLSVLSELAMPVDVYPCWLNFC